MSVSDTIQDFSRFILLVTVACASIQIHTDEGRALVWTLAYLAILYFFLLTIMKYRAGHHRKVRKWQKLYSNIGGPNNSWKCLREIFIGEAKMTPVSSPLCAEACDSFCCIVVWGLFPPAIVRAFMLVRVLLVYVQIFVFLNCLDSFVYADNLICNGRRYRFVRRGVFFSAFEDERQNKLYYPTIDRHGLLQLDHE